MDSPPASLSAVPWVESPDFEAELNSRSSGLTDQQRQVAIDLNRDGYAVLRRFVPDELCDRIRSEVEPFFEEEYAQAERRVPDAWRRGATTVREAALFGPIQDCLRAVYGRQPIPFQTLNFKWGTEQGFHSDSVHFTSMPDRFMCGVWVALQDVDASCGPLAYYPGSHRIPQLMTFEPGDSPSRYSELERTRLELAQTTGGEPVEFYAQKGDALIWTSNVLHGGRPIRREGSTRWSQVTHYYFEDCIYFQPIYSDALSGEVRLMNIIDLNTLEAVPQRYNGRDVSLEPLPDGRFHLSIAGVGAARRGLEEELSAAKAELDNIKSSESFRIGQAILAPLRWARRRRAPDPTA